MSKNIKKVLKLPLVGPYGHQYRSERLHEPLCGSIGEFIGNQWISSIYFLKNRASEACSSK